MKVAIVILHYKNIDDTVKCLRSVGRLDRRDLEIKVILVSNDFVSEGSRLGSDLDFFKGLIPVDIIHNKKNLGFAAGVNVGIKEALKDKKTDYILILNNDTILPQNLLKVLLKDKIDIVSPVIKFESLEGKWVYDYGGRINWWIGRPKHLESTYLYPSSSRFQISSPGRSSLQDKPFGHLPGVLRHTDSQLTINNQQLTIRNIDYVSGCCVLVRREVFEKIGLFDERYFFYFEDADFCIRAKKAGLKTEVNPQVAVFHKLGGSIGRWSNKAIFYNLLGNFIFISKHLGWRRPIGYLYLLVLTGKIIIDRSFAVL